MENGAVDEIDIDEWLECVKETQSDEDGLIVAISVEHRDRRPLKYQVAVGSMGGFKLSSTGPVANFEIAQTEFLVEKSSSPTRGVMAFSARNFDLSKVLADATVSRFAEHIFERLTDEISDNGWKSVFPSQAAFGRDVLRALQDTIGVEFAA